jgi:hypothetical protein
MTFVRPRRRRCRSLVRGGLRAAGHHGSRGRGAVFHPVPQLTRPAGHVGGAAGPCCRIGGGKLGHQGRHLVGHRFGPGWQGPAPARWPRRRFGHVGHWGKAAQAGMSHHAQRVQIIAGIRLGSRFLSWFVVTRGFRRLRKAKIGDLHHVAGSQQQAARRDIAVHQSGPVRRGQAGRRLRDDVHHPCRVHRAAGEHRGRRGPAGQFHHHEWRIGGGRLVVVVDAGDVLMAQRPRVPRPARNRASFPASPAGPHRSNLTATRRPKITSVASHASPEPLTESRSSSRYRHPGMPREESTRRPLPPARAAKPGHLPGYRSRSPTAPPQGCSGTRRWRSGPMQEYAVCTVCRLKKPQCDRRHFPLRHPFDQ